MEVDETCVGCPAGKRGVGIVLEPRADEDRLGLALAEAERAQRGLWEAEDVRRCREGVQSTRGRSSGRGETAEERQSGCE